MILAALVNIIEAYWSDNIMLSVLHCFQVLRARRKLVPVTFNVTARATRTP